MDYCKNESQLRDLRLGRQSSFEKMIGRRPNCFFSPGIETSFGHIYSTFLEVASRNGVKVDVDVNDFLSYISGHMDSHGECFEARSLKLSTNVCDPVRTNGMYRYMILKGLDEVLCYEVMEDIYGPDKVPKRFEQNDY
ncbi:MAG: hypothetical protein KC550_07215 [Nanoarchaeota archaeon]|nr:hypothetical protein [Nanoarchaeota archaeon]